MSFPKSVREDALVKSHRRCCICHEFAGRSEDVHHIVQEADGGANTIDNAIALCPKCHGEAGHYNPRHPLGTKYSPQELRRHRDQWWELCTQNPEEAFRGGQPAEAKRGTPDPDFSALPESVQDAAIQEGIRRLFIKTWGRSPSKQELYDQLKKTIVNQGISSVTNEDLTISEGEKKAQ